MDVAAYWQVVKRQRKVVAGGLVIAFVLALLGLFKVSGDGIGYRTPRVYHAMSTIFVTQTGFPWGRSTLDEFVKGKGDPNATVPRFSDPSRMEYLASLYSSLATSDPIEKLVEQRFGKLDESKKEEYVSSTVAGSDQRPLPIFKIEAFSTSAARADRLALVTANGLRDYIGSQQVANGIPKGSRIQLQIVKTPGADVFEGVKLTTPIMLFLLAVIVTTLVAFTRDNMARGRAAQVTAGDGIEAAPTSATPKRAVRTRKTAASTAAEKAAPTGDTVVEADAAKRPARQLTPVVSPRSGSTRKRSTAPADPEEKEPAETPVTVSKVVSARAAAPGGRFGGAEPAEPKAAPPPWRV